MKLKYKYISISLVVALLPLILAMGISLFHSEKITHDLTISTVQARLSSSAEQISGFFQSRSAEIHSYAATPLLRSMDWTRIGPFLKSELEKHIGIYEKFILSDTDSHFYNTSGGNPYFGGLRTFNDNSPNTRPKSLRKRNFWQYIVGDNIKGEMRERISEPVKSYTTGVTQVVIAAAILSRGPSVVGVLGGTIEWSNIESLVNSARNMFLNEYGETAKLFMISHLGTYVYHWDSSRVIRFRDEFEGDEILNDIGEKNTVSQNILGEPVKELAAAGKKMISGESGFSRYRDPESGLRMFIIYAPVKSANYSMALVMPEATVLRPVRALRLTLLGIIGAAVLLILVMAPLMAGRISGPVTALSTAVRNFIPTGDTEEIDSGGSNDEIDYLVRSTNKMMETISEREQSLKKSEERYRELVENINDTYFIMDQNGTVTYASPVVTRVFGYTTEEVTGTNFTNHVVEEDLPMIMRDLAELKSGILKPSEFRVHDKVGELHWVRTSSMPVWAGDDLIEIRGIISDITDSKKAERELRESEEMNRLLIRYSPVGIIYYDTDMRITGCNERFISLLNTTHENLIGLDMRLLNDKSVLPTLEKALKGEDSYMEGPYHATSGDAFIHMSLRCAAIFTENGEVRGAIGIVEDITERHKSEQALRESLAEKETLLRELYHRTKNNMQVIQSLLSLQAERITDHSTREVLEITEKRIMAMSLVHKQLYQSESLSRINLAEYISEFANLIVENYQAERKISLDMDLEPVPVLIDTAIPCGLVLNELLTNSFRHAFTDSAGGAISIRLKRFDQEGINILYRDNGKGVSSGFDFRKSGGLGYQIIYSIVEQQLQGTISVENDNGISCNITFMDNLYRERV